MDESADKGLKLLGSDASIPKVSDVGRIIVKGYDTGLPRDDVERALRKHFASCGEITNDPIALPVMQPFQTAVTFVTYTHNSNIAKYSRSESSKTPDKSAKKKRKLSEEATMESKPISSCVGKQTPDPEIS